ncbi:MAG: CHASE2 domain-containing protein, partial [Bdellovibrionales bacterium]|nr:CHASE2 domain-containing protein [Bdellovibrionales bacterium]
DPFLAQAERVGTVSLPEDNGVIRRFSTERPQQYQNVVSLAEAAAGMDANQPNPPGQYDYINYYGPARTIPTYSYDSVVQSGNSLAPNTFKDKIVFVGLMLKSASGPAQKESFLSPFQSERIYGTEIHATAAANLLSGDWIKRSNSTTGLVATFVSGLVLLFLIFSIRPSRAILFVAVPCGGWAIASYHYFCNGHFLPGATLFLVFIPLAFVAHTLYQQFIRDFSLMLYRRSQL